MCYLQLIVVAFAVVVAFPVVVAGVIVFVLCRRYTASNETWRQREGRQAGRNVSS